MISTVPRSKEYRSKGTGTFVPDTSWLLKDHRRHSARQVATLPPRAKRTLVPLSELRTTHKELHARLNTLFTERSRRLPSPSDSSSKALRSSSRPPLPSVTKSISKKRIPRPPLKHYQPPLRRSCPFIDDSAIESDGEGNDIVSLATTDDGSFAASDLFLRPDYQAARKNIFVTFPSREISRPPSPTFSNASTRPPSPIRARDPAKSFKCDVCLISVTSPGILKHHRNSKKCKNRASRLQVLKCNNCNRTFDTSHNLEKHKKAKHC